MAPGGRRVSWRFYPLADDPTPGVLERVGHRGPVPRFVATFLTPEQAKSIAKRKDRAA
jgi:hypothetical protein